VQRDTSVRPAQQNSYRPPGKLTIGLSRNMAGTADPPFKYAARSSALGKCSYHLTVTRCQPKRTIRDGSIALVSSSSTSVMESIIVIHFLIRTPES